MKVSRFHLKQESIFFPKMYLPHKVHSCALCNPNERSPPFFRSGPEGLKLLSIIWTFNIHNINVFMQRLLNCIVGCVSTFNGQYRVKNHLGYFDGLSSA